MFDSKNSLRGLQIATFRLPLANWEIGAKILAVIWLAFWLVRYRFFEAHFDLLPWVAMVAPFLISGGRQIGFYEKGISLPKAGGYVFLTRDQVLDARLDGERFSVIGPDAEWRGPYSGGTFRIRAQDVGRFRAVLEQFARPIDQPSGTN